MSVQLLSVDTFERLLTSAELLTTSGASKYYWSETRDNVLTLAMLNVRSYNKHYPADAVTERDAAIMFYTGVVPFRKFQNHFELLKALKFLQYNIDIEAHEMDFAEFGAYKFMERAIAQLERHIVYSLPEYHAANWG